MRSLEKSDGLQVFVENSYYPIEKSDFEGLLSRDDLDETAQAIIAQLQDLIAKQGLHPNPNIFSITSSIYYLR